MNFTVERNNLLRSLGRLIGIVERHSSIPILSNVKVEVDQGVMTMTTMDMDISIREIIPISKEVESVNFAIPAFTVHDIIRKMNEDVQFSINDKLSKVGIKSGRSCFSVPLTGVEDFPFLDDSNMGKELAFDAKSFVSLFEKTKFAISSESSRYNLNGSYLHFTGGKLCNVATDGHRLAYASLSGQFGDQSIDCIIPRKTVLELIRLIKDDSVMRVSIPNEAKIRRIKFTIGNTVVLSKIIAAEFPNYTRIIPENHVSYMEVLTSELITVIERVSVIFSDKVRAIRMKIQTENELQLYTNSSNNSSGNESLAIKYEGNVGFEVSFNYSYLLDILHCVDSEFVKFKFSGENSAAVIYGDDSSKILYIIMPISM